MGTRLLVEAKCNIFCFCTSLQVSVAKPRFVPALLGVSESTVPFLYGSYYPWWAHTSLHLACSQTLLQMMAVTVHGKQGVSC